MEEYKHKLETTKAVLQFSYTQLVIAQLCMYVHNYVYLYMIILLSYILINSFVHTFLCRPVAAIYVLPIVLIFCTPLNFGFSNIYNTMISTNEKLYESNLHESNLQYDHRLIIHL